MTDGVLLQSRPLVRSSATGNQRSAGERFAVYPLIGFFSTVAAWIAMILVVPVANIDAVDFITVSGAILSVGVLFPILVALLTRIRDLFRVELLLVLAVFYWLLLDAVQSQSAENFEHIPTGSIRIAFNATALFVVSFWVAWLAILVIKGKGLLPAMRSGLPPVSHQFLYLAILISFALGTAEIFVGCSFSPSCVVQGLYAPRHLAAWKLTTKGNFDTLLHHFRLFGYLVPSLVVAMRHREGRTSWRTLIGIALSIIVLLFVLQEGGRRYMGLILGSAGLVWLLLDRALSLRKLLLAIGGVTLLLVLMQAMIAWRYYGFFNALSEGRELAHRTRSGLVVDTNLLMLSHITDLVPARYPHTGMTGIYSTVAVPIPRSLLPSKPRVRAFDLAGVLNMRVPPTYTWTCSAIGDMYLIGGYFAVVLGGVMFAWLAIRIGRIWAYPPSVENRVFYSICTLVLFLGVRAVHELVVSGLIILALWGLMSLRRVR